MKAILADPAIKEALVPISPTFRQNRRGAILTKNGQPALTISLACNEAGLVSDIFITLNPDKLARLGPINIH
jgi:hypothetical protein